MFDTIQHEGRDAQVKCFGASMRTFRIGDQVRLGRDASEAPDGFTGATEAVQDTDYQIALRGLRSSPSPTACSQCWTTRPDSRPMPTRWWLRTGRG